MLSENMEDKTTICNFKSNCSLLAGGLTCWNLSKYTRSGNACVLITTDGVRDLCPQAESIPHL